MKRLPPPRTFTVTDNLPEGAEIDWTGTFVRIFGADMLAHLAKAPPPDTSRARVRGGRVIAIKGTARD